MIATARILLLGLVMDVIYQAIVFETFHPGEAAMGPSEPGDRERALSGLAVQGIQLQRSQLREIIVLKPGVG